MGDFLNSQWTWIFLSVGTLILAGFVKRFAKREPAGAEWWKYFKKPKQHVRECQACQHFISCAMAKVTECPLLK